MPLPIEPAAGRPDPRHPDEPPALAALTRKPDRGGDRALLDDVLDSERVGTLSTVIDGSPWSVPMLFARDGDTVLLHGSTGAGLLRHVAGGAPVAFTVFALDALVIAASLFDHSANYRSAVIRGTLTPVADPIAALEVLSDKLIPGRSAETSAITGKERAATVMLGLPIADGAWIAKTRTGGPNADTDDWTGVLPVHRTFGEPITYTGTRIPDSVRRLADSD